MQNNGTVAKITVVSCDDDGDDDVEILEKAILMTEVKYVAMMWRFMMIQYA